MNVLHFDLETFASKPCSSITRKHEQSPVSDKTQDEARTRIGLDAGGGLQSEGEASRKHPGALGNEVEVSRKWTALIGCNDAKQQAVLHWSISLPRRQARGLRARLRAPHQGTTSNITPNIHVLKFSQNNINDGYSDEYTEAFFPTCDALLERANAAISAKDHSQASSLYFRIAALYRISRFPIMKSPVKYKAWEAQKSAYMAATRNWVDPLTEELVPHVFKTEEEGDTIPVYVRTPVTASSKNPVPTMLLITGLDGYRCDNTQRTYEFISRGWAVVIAEIPGTGMFTTILSRRHAFTLAICSISQPTALGILRMRAAQIVYGIASSRGCKRRRSST